MFLSEHVTFCSFRIQRIPLAMPYLGPYPVRQDQHRQLFVSVLFSFPVCKLSASLPVMNQKDIVNMYPNY